MTTPSAPASYARGDALRSRVIFTLGVLLVWRLLSWLPLPGLSDEVVALMARGSATGMPSHIGIMAVGLTPFMAAWAMTELARGSFRKGAVDKARRYLTALLAAGQALGLAMALEGVSHAVLDPGWTFRIGAVATLVGGTMVMLWLGEEITRRGLGDGIWLLVAVQIVIALPEWFAIAGNMFASGALPGPVLAATLAATLAFVVLIVGVETAERRVPVSPESAGNGAERLVLHIDNVTILPATIASMLLMTPAVVSIAVGALFGKVAWLSDLAEGFLSMKPLQLAAIALLVMPLTVGLTAIVCRPRDIVGPLRLGGASIAGETPSESKRYIGGVIGRLAAIAAPYLLVISVVPEILPYATGITLPLAGVQFLVVVLVALRILRQARAIMEETYLPASRMIS